MKNRSSISQVTFILKDGLSTLATWQQQVFQRPTVGEAYLLPETIHADFYNYGEHATVNRIEVGKIDQIELEARCPMEAQNRAVVVLNSDRFSDSTRDSVERELRHLMKFPLISWEAKQAADPVVRFHDPLTRRKSCPPELLEQLLNLAHTPMSV